MLKTIYLTLFTFITLFIVAPISAAEVEFFDSTNHYLGAWQLTDKSAWELLEDVQVSKFQVWYNWDQGEATLPVKVFKEGELFSEFIATRASCDPYQKLWCNADYQIHKLFPAGKYTTEIPSAKQCLKPGGTGAIRLYREDGVVSTPAPSPTIAPIIATPLASPSTSTNCACNQTAIILSAVAASIFTSLLTSLLTKKLLS